MKRSSRDLDLDRRWIFLLVALASSIPILFPLGFPVTTTQSTRMRLRLHRVASSPATSSGSPSTTARRPRRRTIRWPRRSCVTASQEAPGGRDALYPLGGLGLANNSLARVAGEFPNWYGVDYVNLGYKDGAAAVMRRLGEDIAGRVPRPT